MSTRKVFYLLNIFPYRIFLSACCVQDRKIDNDTINFSENVGYETLILVHALVRHGDRTPGVKHCPPNDPHRNRTYCPYGSGHLTNRGKLRSYNLGLNLRRRYDKFFKDFTSKIVNARSTDYERTQCTLQLILAGLFPPEKELIWLKGFNWQPIKIRSDNILHEKIFPNIHSIELQAALKDFESSKFVLDLKDKYQDVFDYLSQVSGKKVDSFLELLFWYFVFLNEEEFGLILPDWVLKVYPQPLKDITIHTYKIVNGTRNMQFITSGPLLNKILQDTEKKIESEKDETKIYLYCAHEWNISSILITLNVFDDHIPPYASCLLFEVHKIDSIFGMKIFYFDYTTKDPKLIKLPNCEEFCPLDKFRKIVQDLGQE